MRALRIVFSQEGGKVRSGNTLHSFSANYIVITDTDTKISPNGKNCFIIDFHVGDLQSLYRDIANLLDQKTPSIFYREPLRQIKADQEVARVIQLLANANRSTLLRFIYVYCLGYDQQYFSALLRQSVAGDQPFLDFIEKNFLNSWPISRFAKELDMPLRKFNLLFQEKFGTSAKHWLLIRRLEHAREMLLSTSLKVLDDATTCGFSNHAHFTGSFRKYFNCSPSEIRQMINNELTPKPGARKVGRPRTTLGEHYGLTGHY